MKAFQWVSWIVAMSLQVLVLSAMLKGAYRQFAFVFAYLVALFLGTVVEIALFLNGPVTRASVRYYWINDAILQGLLFCLVIALIYQSVDREKRARVRRWSVAGSLAMLAVSVAAHQGPRVWLWLTRVSRDISFAAAILDLILWFTLLAKKEKDHRLLMVSGALGIQFTGSAIGQTLRQLSPAAVPFGNIVMVVAHSVCLYAWWQTFRERQAGAETGPRPRLRE